MIHKSDITSLIQEKLKLFDRGLHDRQLIHPQRDWFSGVSATLLILMLIGAWSGRTYLNNFQIEPSESPTDTSAVVYRAQLVAEVLAARQAEHQVFDQLLQLSAVNTQPEPEPLASSTPAIASITSPTTTPLASVEASASSTEVEN